MRIGHGNGGRMNTAQLKVGLVGVLIASAMLLSFQNCGPAKLVGDGSLDAASTAGADLVGSKVDLPTLLKSSAEPSANVLSPLPSAQNNFDYTVGAPIIENVLLLKNDFTLIEWIQDATQTVVSVGETFHKPSFATKDLGTYHIIGYRDQTPYVIGTFSLVPKTTASLSVSATGAVQTAQKVVASDGLNETILVTVDAPAVDLASVKMTLQPANTVIENKRAILVNKKINEAVTVQIDLADLAARTLVPKLSLIAKDLPNSIQMATGFTATVTAATMTITYSIKNAQPFTVEQWMFIHISDINAPLTAVVADSFAPTVPTSLWNSNTQTFTRTITLPATMANGTYVIRAGVFMPVSPWDRSKLNVGSGVKEDINMRYIIGQFKLAR